jgi:hypothetical protein
VYQLHAVLLLWLQSQACALQVKPLLQVMHHLWQLSL